MRNSFRLGVNIDHVATLRNSRGVNYPSPLRAAKTLDDKKVDSITIHLREDRRHIVDRDVKELIEQQDFPVNLEMAATQEMKIIACKYKPFAVCLVPERREERTTEGGLDVLTSEPYLKNFVIPLKEAGCRVSIFVSPSEQQIEACVRVGVDAVEINTGTYCDYLSSNEIEKARMESDKIKEIAAYASSQKLEVHAGHGLTFDNVSEIAQCLEISEFNIGHFLVSEAIFVGLHESVNHMHRVITSVRD